MVATAAALVRCDCCGTMQPAAETFQPYSGVARCKDTAGCERRALCAYDPTILPAEEMPAPPAAATAQGAACGYCRANDPPGGLYERSPGSWFCRARGGCEQRGVEIQFLHAHSDMSPDRLISSAQMRQAVSDAGPERPVTRTPQYLEAAAEHAKADLEYNIGMAARRG